MTCRTWNAHSGGGLLVVTDSHDVWTAVLTRDAAPRFELLDRELLPPEPIAAVATDGACLVAAAVHPHWHPHGEHDAVTDATLSVIELEGAVVVGHCELARFGGHLGIWAGHVLSWAWSAQGGMLHIEAPLAIGEGATAIDPRTLEAFQQCDLLAAHGELLAGSTSYKGTLQLATPASGLRTVPLPQQYGRHTHEPFLAFDLDGWPVMTYHRRSSEREAWRLDARDQWQHLGRWKPRRGAMLQFAGVDGRPMGMTAGELPSL